MIWERTYDPTPDRELFNKVVQTDHGYALLGENRKGAYPQIESRFEVLKLGKNGEIVNNTIFGEPNLYSSGRGTASPDGGFVLTGQVNVSEKYILQLTKLSHSQDNPPVERTLTCIVFTDSTKKIAVGENAPATVNAHYSDGSEAGISDSVSFTSEDEDTATVDSKGLITGVKPGSTTINAVYKGLSAQLKVDVSESPGSGDPDPVEGSFYLDSDEYSLTAGTSLDTIAFFKDKDGKIHDVTKQSVFSSENVKIADYDKNGNIIGVHAGITYITAEYQGKTYRALVQVVRASVPK
ncbi:Bacterial Ig-like domain (group 2) [compost metagenome]